MRNSVSIAGSLAIDEDVVLDGVLGDVHVRDLGRIEHSADLAGQIRSVLVINAAGEAAVRQDTLLVDIVQGIAGGDLFDNAVDLANFVGVRRILGAGGQDAVRTAEVGVVRSQGNMDNARDIVTAGRRSAGEVTVRKDGLALDNLILVVNVVNGLDGRGLIGDRSVGPVGAEVTILVADDDAADVHQVIDLLAEGLAGGDGGRTDVLNGLGVDGIANEDRGRFTIESGVDVLGFEVLQQADAVRELRGVGLPGRAFEAFNLGIIAQADEDHLDGLKAGDVVLRQHIAVAVTNHQLVQVAVVDVRDAPSIKRVVEGQGGNGIEGGDIRIRERDGHHLRELGTGDETRGLEGTVRITIDDTQSGQNVDGFGAGSGQFSRVRVVRGFGDGRDGAGEHGQHEGQAQNQRENLGEVSHGLVSSLKIFCRRRTVRG
ncbi:MAG: hypothetical protein SO063_12605 [Eubacteriales bacterium]|nr:hypothetical protein [Eubacteriales bacterium]